MRQSETYLIAIIAISVAGTFIIGSWLTQLVTGHSLFEWKMPPDYSATYMARIYEERTATAIMYEQTQAADELNRANATLQALTATSTPTAVWDNALATKRSALMTLTPEVVTP